MFLQPSWFKVLLPGRDWFGFIVTTRGDGSVISSGTNKMLMYCVESWVTRAHLPFTAVQLIFKEIIVCG